MPALSRVIRECEGMEVIDKGWMGVEGVADIEDVWIMEKEDGYRSLDERDGCRSVGELDGEKGWWHYYKYGL